jgi:hypothetical protein
MAQANRHRASAYGPSRHRQSHQAANGAKGAENTGDTELLVSTD